MKRTLTLLCLLALTGCRTAPVPRPAVVSAPVVASQEGKDRAILTEAAQIDALAPAAKPHTDAQRAAVAAAPAADVAKLVKDYEATVSEQAERIAALTTTVEKLKDAEKKKQVSICRWAGFALLALAALLVYAKLTPFAIASAVGGFLALGLAQLLSQPWFTTALNIALGVCAVAAVAAAWHAYQRHLKASDEESENTRWKEALRVLVPAVDKALESISPSDRITFTDTLGRVMDADHKRLVKEIRATI